MVDVHEPTRQPEETSGPARRPLLLLVVGVVGAVLVAGLAFVVARSLASEDSTTVEPAAGDETGSSPAAPTGTDLSSTNQRLDGYLAQDGDGVFVQSPDGKRTTVIDHPVARFGDDGAGGVVYQERRTTGDGTSGDWALISSTPADAREAAIWYLPAGATAPVAVKESQQPQARWFALQGVGVLGDRPAVVFDTVDRDPARGEDDELRGSTILRYLDDGTEHELVGERSYYEGSPGPATFAGDRVAIEVGYEYAAFSMFGPDGTPIASGCPDPSAPSGCEPTSALRSATEFFALHVEDGGAAFYAASIVDARTGTKLRDLGNGPEQEAFNPPAYVDAVGDRAVISWRAVGDDGGGARRSLLVDLDKDAWTELPFTGQTRILRSPLIRPTVSPDETPGEEAAPAPTWEEVSDAEIPSVCGHPPTRLVDGVHAGIAEGQGTLRLLLSLSGGAGGVVRGLTSADGGPLTAVVAECNAGGVGWPNQILLFGRGGRFYAASDLYESYEDLWAAAGFNAPGRDGVRLMRTDGATLSVALTAETGTDPSCCPTGRAVVTAHAEGHELVVDSVGPM